MTLAGFIVRNALRNKRRLMLTVSSVAVSLFLLMVLQVVLRGMTDPKATDAAALRLAVRHKVSLANMLFSRSKQRILEMPGVVACTKLLWFGGIYQDEKNFFPQFACDAEDLFKVLVEARIDPAQKEAFIRERTACVVGVKTMKRFGWQLGQKITLMGAMWPCDLELTIRGVFEESLEDSNLFFHHEYFDEQLGDQGFTGLFWVRADSAERVPELIERIDAEFANTDAETVTETERSFMVGFVSMLGNLKLLIGSISTVVVFTLLLVTAGTMSMAIRERVRELAIVKALGFGRTQVFSLILAESFGLAMVGAILGGGLAVLLVSAVDFHKLSSGLFVTFQLTPEMLARGLLVAALLGIGSGFLPALSAVRRTVIEGLGTVE